MRLLVVEDDEAIARVIQRGLTAAGYAVDVAYDGEEGLALARQRSYGLMLLDVMLPRRDGWSVCRALRGDPHRPMVLMLTARDGVEDRVRGFEAGADDYLAKPFHFAELLLRVRALLRRAEGAEDAAHEEELALSA